MSEREDVARTACCSGVLCADPIDGRQAGSCDLCLGAADRIIAQYIAPLREELQQFILANIGMGNELHDLRQALAKAEEHLDAARKIAKVHLDRAAKAEAERADAIELKRIDAALESVLGDLERYETRSHAVDEVCLMAKASEPGPSREAYRAGAEAMREACAIELSSLVQVYRAADKRWSYDDLLKAIRALPLPTPKGGAGA